MNQDRRQFVQSVPLGVAMLVGTGCHEEAEGPPVLEQIKELQFTNQEGQPFTKNDLKGKVWVASFMFTRCPSTCPRMMRYMKKLQDQVKAEGVDLHLVTFSVDPENDTPEVLKSFANKYDVDLRNWSFLTGDYESIKQTSIRGFRMSLEGKANPEKSGFGIIHGSHLVLVDQNLDIRGYYPTKKEKTLQRLVDDARSLSARS